MLWLKLKVSKKLWVNLGHDNVYNYTSGLPWISATTTQNVYKFWKETEATNKDVFLLTPDSGEVYIRETGTYLIYTQVRLRVP